MGSRTSNMNIALISCTSKKLFFLLAALVVAAAYGSQIQGPNATTCLDLKKAYQQSSCCNQTISQFATFDTVNLTCDDLLSSYTGSSCCSAELTKSATLIIQTAEPSAEPTAEPTAEPSAELSAEPSAAEPSTAEPSTAPQTKKSEGELCTSNDECSSGVCEGMLGICFG